MARKNAAAAAKGEKRSYPVLDVLRHDGDDYGPGDTVDLTDAQAAPLLATKTVGEAAPAEEKTATS